MSRRVTPCVETYIKRANPSDPWSRCTIKSAEFRGCTVMVVVEKAVIRTTILSTALHKP